MDEEKERGIVLIGTGGVGMAQLAALAGRLAQATEREIVLVDEPDAEIRGAVVEHLSPIDADRILVTDDRPVGGKRIVNVGTTGHCDFGAAAARYLSVPAVAYDPCAKPRLKGLEKSERDFWRGKTHNRKRR